MYYNIYINIFLDSYYMYIIILWVTLSANIHEEGKYTIIDARHLPPHTNTDTYIYLYIYIYIYIIPYRQVDNRTVIDLRGRR